MNILILVSLIAGGFLGYLLRNILSKRISDAAETKAKEILQEAKDKARKVIFEGQDKAIKALQEAKNEEKELKEEIRKTRQALLKKENDLDEQAKKIQSQVADFQAKTAALELVKEKIDSLKKDIALELEKVAKMPLKEAKEILFKKAEENIKDDLVSRIRKLEKEGQEEIERKTKEMLSAVIQRYAASQAADVSTTTVSVSSEDIKGRIIGKEGRNIKTLEKLTGVDIIVDDTPGAVVLSSFDPIRREVASMALGRLMKDGRIQPARIEKVVEEVKEEIQKRIEELGKEAIYELGITSLDPRLIKVLGRLYFRQSFGQNILQHSVEVAHIGAMLAEELGADVAVVKKACLLHDIGKAVDHEVQGTHIDIGKRILEKFGLEDRVIEAAIAHHEDYPLTSLEAVVVQAADAISAARPGARKDTVENYIKRLEELEKIAKSFSEVEKSYAIQAGRELRIFVKPEEIDDLGAMKLAREIAQRIEDEIKYPGEIKVAVIRETRAIEYAR